VYLAPQPARVLEAVLTPQYGMELRRALAADAALLPAAVRPGSALSLTFLLSRDLSATLALRAHLACLGHPNHIRLLCKHYSCMQPCGCRKGCCHQHAVGAVRCYVWHSWLWP
jgi:hypothetical protein